MQAVRGRVWSEPDDDLDAMPRGVAFVAHTLGFLGRGPETAHVRTSGRWMRIALRRGHVLWRGPAHLGMTQVRATHPAR